MVQQVHQAQVVEQQALLVLKVLQALPVPVVVPQALLVRQDHRVLLVLLEQVRLVLRDQLVVKALKVLLVLLGRPELLDQLEQVVLDQQVQQD